MIPLHDEVRLLRNLGDGRRLASLKAWTARRLVVPAVASSASPAPGRRDGARDAPPGAGSGAGMTGSEPAG